MPAAREIRVQGKGSVDQRQHGPDILAEIGQRLGGIRQRARIVPGHLEGSSGEVGALQAVDRRRIAATVEKQPVTAKRGPGESGPVARIARDGLLEQSERFRDLPGRRPDHCMSAQIKVVGGEVGRRAAARTCGFGRL